MKKVEINGSSEKVIDRLVDSGRCQDANQVVAISLRLLDKHEEAVQALRHDIAEGMEQVYGGRTAPLDMEAIIKEAEARYESKNPAP